MVSYTNYREHYPWNEKEERFLYGAFMVMVALGLGIGVLTTLLLCWD